MSLSGVKFDVITNAKKTLQVGPEKYVAYVRNANEELFCVMIPKLKKCTEYT